MTLVRGYSYLMVLATANFAIKINFIPIVLKSIHAISG